MSDMTIGFSDQVSGYVKRTVSEAVLVVAHLRDAFLAYSMGLEYFIACPWPIYRPFHPKPFQPFSSSLILFVQRPASCDSLVNFYACSLISSCAQEGGGKTTIWSILYRFWMAETVCSPYETSICS